MLVMIVVLTGISAFFPESSHSPAVREPDQVMGDSKEKGAERDESFLQVDVKG